MANIQENLHYSKDHEWVSVDGDTATVGITDYAQHALGDVVYVELPKVGATLTKGKACAEIESVKSVNDFYAPIDGVVTEINTALAAQPELLNQDPTGKGWFAKIKPSSTAPLTGLLTSEQYQTQLKK